MNVEEARQVHTCTELAVGDEIEAWHNGRLFHRGTVSRTVASTDLFWIRDSRTGARRLIDFEALVILRAPAPGATAAGGAAAGSGKVASAKAASAAGGHASSHVPLFQAPSMAP
ncbi:hypothetical protein [Pseudarthrobacter sp. S9]|uniref:hypothetical protein n=1 Tax=Pseudarthrobacter sp. S9 TaxID=3418421 RepID=UPI003D047FC8